MSQDGKTLRAGLIGAGIQASRSPAMHMAEARALGLELTYELFDLDRIEGGATALPGLIARLREKNYLGVNITYPVKQTVLDLLDARSAEVRALGACNTVVFQDGRTIGHNTDWIGFAENFRRGLAGAPLDRVLLLGAGGAGSAVGYALLRLGAKHIAVHDPEGDRALALVRRFDDPAGGARVTLSKGLAQEIAAAGGLVNCTPIGMRRHPGTPLPPALLRPEMWVADVVYVPLRTELLRQAAAKGCRCLEGGGMAVFQAAQALRLFTGKSPDADRMLARFQRDAEAEGSRD